MNICKVNCECRHEVEPYLIDIIAMRIYQTMFPFLLKVKTSLKVLNQLITITTKFVERFEKCTFNKAPLLGSINTLLGSKNNLL